MADAGVLPSYYDPCSRTILEAMSLGLPCIASRYDGSSDCIRPHENGFVLSEPEDTSSLAAALAELADPATRGRFAEAALALRPYLAMRRHAEQISALYQELRRRVSSSS
jgi:UDP-glucose:(heptosyl)LPS alpha-1,3-glucosyltransferase